MTAHPERRIAARLAAIPTAGFRAAVVAGLVSLVVMSAAHAQGRSGAKSAAASHGSPGSQGNQGNQGSQESRGSESRGGEAPGHSGGPDSPGKSASAPGQSAASREPGPLAPGPDLATAPAGPAANPDMAPPAPPGFDQSDALDAAQAREIFTLKELLPRVTDRYGGKVIYVALWPDGDRLIYKFKLRTDRGDVRTIRMDAKTGRFLGLGAFFR